MRTFIVQKEVIPIYDYGSGVQVPYYGEVSYVESGITRYFINGKEVDEVEFEDEFVFDSIEEWLKLK